MSHEPIHEDTGSVKWTYRRKGSSLVEVTVEMTYWIDAPAENGAAGAIAGEDFYDGDTGTISGG